MIYAVIAAVLIAVSLFVWRARQTAARNAVPAKKRVNPDEMYKM
jgi:hypothetical protein